MRQLNERAGAYYGEKDIPERWRTRLAFRDLIGQYAEQLYALSQSRSESTP